MANNGSNEPVLVRGKALDTTIVEKYLLEVLQLGPRELFSITTNFSNHICTYSKEQHTFNFDIPYEHESPIFYLAALFARFPGYHNLDRMLNLLARDGYDFAPADCWTTIGCASWRFYVNREASTLDILDLDITPFGVELMYTLIGNGLSEFRWYKESSRYSMSHLLFTLVSTSYSPIPGDFHRFRVATHELVRDMVDLGLHSSYANCNLYMNKDYYKYRSNRPTEEEVVYNELKTYLVESRQHPLTLQALARNATRRIIGGIHFAAQVNKLPLPPAMVDYVLVKANSSLKRVADRSTESEAGSAKRAKVD